jgi:hypothetical protein
MTCRPSQLITRQAGQQARRRDSFSPAHLAGGHVSFGVKGAYGKGRAPDPGSCAPINPAVQRGPDFLFNGKVQARALQARDGGNVRGNPVLPRSARITDYRVPQLVTDNWSRSWASLPGLFWAW